MSSVEKLKEEYEEAYFAYLMGLLMQAEGAAWAEEGRQLRNDPDFQFSEELDERCTQTIQSEIRKRERRSRRNKIFRTVTAACLTVVAAVSVISAVNIEARATVRDLIIEIGNKSMEIISIVGDSLPGYEEKSFAGYSIPVLPEGYVLAKQELSEGYGFRYYVCGDEYIWYDITSYARGATTTYDTENAKITNFRLNNNEAIMIQKRGTVHIIVFDEEHEYIIDLMYSEPDVETALSMVSDIYYLG